MKFNKVIILVLCIFSLTADLLSQPKIHIVNSIVDFGRAKHSREVLHTNVSIVNQGTDTLIISKIVPGCGCTIANISNKNILPGDTAKVDIELTIKNFTGDIKKDITVYSNDTVTPYTFIQLKAYVERAFEVLPKWLAFNRIIVGEPSTAELIIKNHSNLDAVIEDVRFTRSNIICDLSPGDVLPKGTSRTVKFTAIATEKGSLQSTFNIDLYHPEEKTLQVIVYGNAIEKISQDKEKK